MNHYFGTNGYGLFLNMQEYEDFKKAYSEINDVQDAEDAFYSDDVFNAGFAILCEDPYDGRSICHFADIDGENDEDFADGLFLFAEKQGAIFLEDRSRAYANMNEMEEEFKAKFGKYLPGNFSYVDHIAWLNAAQYC